MTRLGIYFDQTRCTGCFTCVIACKDWYDLQDEGLSPMRVEYRERGIFPELCAAYLATPCFQCDQPACAQACPQGAIARRADGIVVVDRAQCVGAERCPRKCLKACPWKAPQFGPQPDARMRKCELCRERLDQGRQPVCVEACPMFALEVGPLEELRAKYGNVRSAEGFKDCPHFGPAVVFKPKKQ